MGLNYGKGIAPYKGLAASPGVAAVIVASGASGGGGGGGTVIISDTFTAVVSGSSISSWTPDVVNTPGNTWTNADGHLVGDGSGHVRTDLNTAMALIDTGITDNKIEIVVEHFPSTPLANFASIIINSGGTFDNNINLALSTTNFSLTSRVSGVNTTVTALSTTRTANVTCTFGTSYDGNNFTINFNGSAVAVLSGYTIDTALSGLSYAGMRFINGSAGTMDNFVVTDLP